MASRIFVLGIDFLWNEFSGKFAQLNVSRSLRPVDTDTFKRRTLGESGDVNQKYDQPILIDLDYALKLEASGAFVGRREYEADLDFNPDDLLGGSIVVKLIPVDAEIKKHFDASLK